MNILVKSLFLGVMVCLGVFVTSCKDDVITEGPNEPAETENVAWLSIRITGPQGVVTKALATEEGTVDESKVNDLLLVFYDTGGNVKYQFPLDIHSSGSSSIEGNDLYKGNTSKQFQTVAKQVERQDYKLLVVLNPRDAILAATAKGSNISTFREAVGVNDVRELTGEKYDNFLMCNWQDLVEADGSTSLFPTEEEALGNPLTVHVERAVGKVIVDAPSGSGSAFSIEGWTLNVINRKTYWMRQPWLAVNKNGTGATVEESPNVADRFLNYAKDPNSARDQYPGNAWHSYGAWQDNGGEGEAPGFPDKDNFTFIETASAEWTEPGISNRLYATENTMEPEQQYEDVSTSVVLKAKYNPAKSTLGATIGSGDPYFVYIKGKKRFVFTAGELDAEYERQQSQGGEQVTYADPLMQRFMDDIALYRKLLRKDVSFAAYASANKSASLGVAFSFIDNTHVNYYRIPVLHFNKWEQPDPKGYGRYGIVRNNVYKFTVDDIFGPGTAEIGISGNGYGNPGNPGDPKLPGSTPPGDDDPVDPDAPDPNNPNNPPVDPDNPYAPPGPNYPDPDDPNDPNDPNNPNDPGGGGPIGPGDPDDPDNPGGPGDPDSGGVDPPDNPGDDDDPPGGGGDPPGDDDDDDDPPPPFPPDPPVEPGDDATWISFRVEVMDWTIRMHGVSAGNE